MLTLMFKSLPAWVLVPRAMASMVSTWAAARTGMVNIATRAIRQAVLASFCSMFMFSLPENLITAVARNTGQWARRGKRLGKTRPDGTAGSMITDQQRRQNMKRRQGRPLHSRHDAWM